MAEQSIIARFSGADVQNMAWEEDGSPKYPQAVGRANSYLCPAGTGPAIGYVLLLGRDWQRLWKKAGKPVLLDGADETISTPNSDARQIVRILAAPFALDLAAGDTVSIPRCYVVSAQNVSGGAAGDPNAVYMLKITDRRWFARMSEVDIQINVRRPAPAVDPGVSAVGLYLVDSLDSLTTIYTWTRACEVLWDSITAFTGIAFPGLPYSPDGVPDNFHFIGVPAIDALGTLLDKINCELLYDPEADTFTIAATFRPSQQLETFLASEPAYLDDGDCFTNIVALVPETIHVLFRRQDKHYGTERTIGRDNAQWLTDAWKVESVATNLVGAIAGTIVTLWDDLPAIFEFNGNPQNAAAVTARAAERAKKYVDTLIQCGGRQRTVYQGIVSLAPDQQINAIHWKDTGDGWVTQIWNFPGRFSVDDADDGLRLTFDGPLSEHLETPDFARFTTPGYPPLTHLVQVDGSTFGAFTSPNAGGLISGEVLRTDPEALAHEAGVICWVLLANELSALGGVKVPQGERYIARLNGTASYAGDFRPLFIVHRDDNWMFAAVSAAVIATGGSGAVTLSTGTSVSAKNVGSDTIHVSDKILAFVDWYQGGWCCFAGVAGTDKMAIVAPYGTTADGNCLWSGKVQAVASGNSYCSNQFSNDTACYLTVLNTDNGSTAAVKTTLDVGEPYIGRHIADFDNGDTTFTPIYAIRVDPDAGTRWLQFRLYQQLKTSQASQAAVTVVDYWGGPDPDPTVAGITVYNMLTDNAGVYAFSGDANAVGYATLDKRHNQWRIVRIEGDGQRWLLVKNNSGVTIPANSCVAVLSDSREANGHVNKRNVLLVDQPDTTLRKLYLITGNADIAGNDIGLAFSTESWSEATYGGTDTPTNGDTYGPKHGSYLLWKNYPGFLVEGLNNDDQLAVVRHDPIKSIMGKPVSDIAAAGDDGNPISGPTPGSGTCQAWVSNGAALVNSGMTFTGFNYSRTVIIGSILTQFVEAGGQFVVPTPANCIWQGVANAVIPSGTGGPMTITPGGTVTVINLSGSDLQIGDFAAVFLDLFAGFYFCMKGGSGATLIRFELTADLVYGTDPGGDNAVIVTYHDGDYHSDGSAITVYDGLVDTTDDGATYGAWAGLKDRTSPLRSGYQGWAIFKPDSSRYEIVWMDQKARFIEFTLTTTFATTDASSSTCTVNAYWDGRNPDPTAAGVTVYNKPAKTNYEFSGSAGDKGYAIWDEKLSHYRIVVLKVGGKITADFADAVANGGDATAPTRFDFTSDTFVISTGETVKNVGMQAIKRNDPVFAFIDSNNGVLSGFRAPGPRVTLENQNFEDGTVAPYQCVEIVGVSFGGFDGSNAALQVAIPGSTFTGLYIHNERADCTINSEPQDGFYVHSPISVATPVQGEIWGPQPGGLELTKGFPGFRCIGPDLSGFYPSTSPTFMFQREPIQILLAQPHIVPIANNTHTHQYKILCGNQGSESDAGWTPPEAYNRSGYIRVGQMCLLVQFPSTWELIPLPFGPVCRQFYGTVSGNFVNSSSTFSVTTTTALDGGQTPGTVTVKNGPGQAGNNGDACMIQEDRSGSVVAYQLCWVHQDVLTILTDSKVDSTSNTTKFQKTTQSILGKANGAPADADVVSLADQIIVDNVKTDNANRKLQQTKKTIKRFPTTAADADSDVDQGTNCS